MGHLFIGINLLVLGLVCLALGRSFGRASGAPAPPALAAALIQAFAIQGPAVLASRPLERLARRGGIAGRASAHVVTILFMAVTSVLFFHGVSEVFPSVLVNGSPLP